MEGFIHVHHVKQISKLGPNYKVDAIRDLRPVCANCHAVLHRNEPAYSMGQVLHFLHNQEDP
jgi:5-methylcytosine-specific restriction protein A